jgi:hypothetical protein
MKLIRCSGLNIEGRRCKHKAFLPKDRIWTCVDHTIDYESSNMEETKARRFYMIKEEDYRDYMVQEVRSKFYQDGKIRYMIAKCNQVSFVSREDFYDVPSGMEFIVVD